MILRWQCRLLPPRVCRRRFLRVSLFLLPRYIAVTILTTRTFSSRVWRWTRHLLPHLLRTLLSQIVQSTLPCWTVFAVAFVSQGRPQTPRSRLQSRLNHGVDGFGKSLFRQQRPPSSAPLLSLLEQRALSPLSDNDRLAPLGGCIDTVRRRKATYQSNVAHVSSASRRASGVIRIEFEIMGVNKLYDHSENTPDLVASATDLQGQRLLCHCKESEECHADSPVAAFLAAFPGACVTGKSQDPLSQAVALAAAEARTERNEHSGPDVDAPYLVPDGSATVAPLQSSAPWLARRRQLMFSRQMAPTKTKVHCQLRLIIGCGRYMGCCPRAGTLRIGGRSRHGVNKLKPVSILRN